MALAGTVRSWWATLPFVLFITGAPLSFAATAPAAPHAVQFTDVTGAAGIDFVHSFGDTKFSNLVEAVGGGAAWLDFDQDGFVDLYLVTGKYHQGVSEGPKPGRDPVNRLYRNRGDGTFEDVTTKAAVGCRGCYSMAVAVADYDNDGHPDIYVANHGPNVLYRNRGDGTFEDVTAQAGVGDPGCSVGAAWFDLDRDGLLDLYVGNYIDFDPDYRLYFKPDGFPGPLAYAGQLHHLYRNLGGGRFEEIGQQLGLTRPARAMSVAAGDYDGDGYTDLFVTNDATEDFLLHNVGGKKLEDVALRAGVAFNGMGDQTASMAVDFGDYDGDGRADILVSDNSLSSLFRNVGDGTFEDLSPEVGIARASAQFVGWGAFFFDYDNDGDLDIFKVNSDLSRLFGQEDQMFENRDGRFHDVSLRMGPYFREERMGRGAAFADYDNDGDADIVIVNIDSDAVLLRNEGGNRNRSLALRLVGRASNRDGIGAMVRVTAGGRVQTAEKRSTRGYLSQSDPRMLFGLGSAGAAGQIEVRWPSGRSQQLKGIAAQGTITIAEPED